MKSKITWCLALGLLFLTQLTFAQLKTVTGTVTDDNNMPLPGVNIVVQGTSAGTQTDFDGNYSISAQQGQTLVFSYVGFEENQQVVGASSTINVTLVAGEALDEVVVLGYSKVSKAEVTGSTVQLASEAIEQVPVASVDQVLQGKVAGLVFNTASGTPGSTANIRIRGISSITAGNEPLYVIDGVPVVNSNLSGSGADSSLSPLASINSNNIESITVLKDASATAAYGARGSNGVIVITTKNGQSGKTTFNISSTYGFSNDAIDGPQVLTAADRETLFYEALFNTYGASSGFTRDQAQAFYEANTGAFGADYLNWNAAGRPEANWGDRITNKNAPLQDITVSASGGTETSNFYTSLGYYTQEATVIGSDFERISGQLNFSKDLTESLKFSTSNSGSYSYQDGLLEASAYFSSPRAAKYFMPPTDQPYNEDGTINLNTGLPNPIYIAEQNLNDSKLTRILTNNSLAWATPIENLSVTSRVAIDYQVYNYVNYQNRIAGDGAGSNGYSFQQIQNRANYVFQNFVDYTLNLDDENSIDFKLLQEYQKNRLYALSAEGNNFSDDGLYYLSSAGNPTTASSSFSDWAVGSYLAQAHYSGFGGKYILDATYRREGNSRFSPENRWGDFGSVGAAWNLQKENFLVNSDVVNALKLRASYGVTGNANIGLNQYQALLAYDANYAGAGASYPSTFGNNDLSWEVAHTLDVGVDYGLFQNRISGSVAYYRRETKDMLLNVPLSQTTGFSSQTRNIGRMENKGLEIELSADLVRSEKFNITLGGNVALNDNEVLELAKDPTGADIEITTNTTRIAVGHPVRGWYMPTWAGVDPDNGDELYYVDGEGSETTNDFNAANPVWQGGSAIPKVTAGLNLHIDYAGFFLDANGYYAGGHKVYEEWHRYTQGRDLFSLLYYQGLDTMLDRWQQPGDTGTRFGRMQATTFPWQRHSKFLYDGDFFRIKTATFGYDFNSNVTEKIGVAGLRLFVRGTNLFTWVKDDNFLYDPETAADGYTSLTTPPVQSFIFGVNLKL